MAAFDDHTAEAINRRQREWVKFDQDELNDAVRAMLEHKQTRQYLWWLLTISKAIGENAFTGNALSTAFECGMQNVGQEIMAHLIGCAPEGFITLMKENAGERARRDSELDRIRASRAAPDDDAGDEAA